MASVDEVQALRLHLQVLEAEVHNLKAKLNEKKEEKKEEKPNYNKKRDIFTSKKGFSDVPHFDGKIEKYDDWRFKATTFMEIEDNFKEFLEMIEKLPQMPTEENLNEWEDEDDERDAKIMNEQLFNFLCLNLKDEALTMGQTTR